MSDSFQPAVGPFAVRMPPGWRGARRGGPLAFLALLFLAIVGAIVGVLLLIPLVIFGVVAAIVVGIALRLRRLVVSLRGSARRPRDGDGRENVRVVRRGA